MYKVFFTDSAKSDLRRISLNIAEVSQNKQFAKDFIRQIASSCAILSDFPLSGAVPRDRTTAVLGYRFLVYKDYLIFYTVDDSLLRVYVSAIFNAKQDYTRVMKNIK